MEIPKMNVINLYGISLITLFIYLFIYLATVIPLYNVQATLQINIKKAFFMHFILTLEI